MKKYTTGSGEETETLLVGPCAVRFEDDFNEAVRLINAAVSKEVQNDREWVSKRLVEWMKTDKPAVTAFTEGPLRLIAYAVEEKVQAARERAMEERFQFIRCQGPDDILVVPDNANPEDYTRFKSPCHNHIVMREAHFLSLKSSTRDGEGR